MFIRFRPTETRLQVSVIETSRHNGKVRQHHVAGLGSLPRQPLLGDRVAFWEYVDQQMHALSKRIDATTREKLRGEIEARAPLRAVHDVALGHSSCPTLLVMCHSCQWIFCQRPGLPMYSSAKVAISFSPSQ